MDGWRFFREAMTAFLDRGDRFLRVDGAFRGGVFGCGEACPLSERLVEVV